jgi:putative glycosyltransferase (TIGR04348 family)
MRSAAKPVVCIVTPGTRNANNGNWRTAVRWAALLRDRYRVIVQTAWDGTMADALIGLHALRSADSIARFRGESARGGLAVVLTGTDLYRDLPESARAASSLDVADRIVVLQEDAQRLLAPAWRAKSQVILQSARPLPARRKPRDRLDCVVVGHLREEKDPQTLFRALAQVPEAVPIRVRHIGAALDKKLMHAARDLASRDRRYRYAGALPHGLARAAIAHAHLLVHPSVIEGGANVIVEAITSHTPVVASRISGNVGMLGATYPGYFEPRDASGLAAQLVRAWEQPAWLRELGVACGRRLPLFQPAAERRALRALVEGLLAHARR